MSTTRTSNGHAISSPIPIPSQPTEPVDLLPHAPHYTLRRTLPNTPLAVSIISALLGGLVFTSIFAAFQPTFRLLGSGSWAWARSRLGMYGFAMGVFHLFEFWTTAGWNIQKLSVDAFLLNNTMHYNLAHAVGLLEYFISSYFFPGKYNTWFCSTPIIVAAITVLLAGQATRSLAMIHANTSFSHIVKSVKHDDHTLITHGVYQYSRHPSYVGFFYWAVATQVLLGNILSTLAFIVALGRFFSARIVEEEEYLVRFFGDDYIRYRKEVGTGLPFMISSA